MHMHFGNVKAGVGNTCFERCLRAFFSLAQALVIKDGSDFQHILRILGTNVDGKQKVMYAMTAIKGVGRRFSNIVCKKADVDMDKRAGELTQKEMDDLVNVIQNPLEYKIPQWMLNRRKDFKDGKTSQISSNRKFIFSPAQASIWAMKWKSCITC
jgi:ribosomal protein S13